MEVKKVNLVYFSPTGTTRKVLEGIAEGIAACNVEHIDLTLPEGAGEIPVPLSDELVILGAPVYGGRVPVDAINRFKKLKADKTPAVVVVVYGNREFEDALLELKDLSVELGFTPVAGAAFIGEHSFSTKEAPIANGRPDSLDIQKAMDFGARVKEKVINLHSADDQLDLEIPGRFPYESGPRSITASPVTGEDTCILCGRCVGVCPTAAISINGVVATRIEPCIRCTACVKNCPTGARVWEDGMVKKMASWLNENCSARKEPQVFGITS
jgi:ferredoxin